MPTRRSFRGRALKCTPAPEGVKPKKAWGRYFGTEWAVAFRMPYGNTPLVFFDKRLRSGNPARVKRLVGQEFIPARIITCEGKEWIVRAEPTGDGTCGFTVYTTTGKAIIAGTGRVSARGEWTAEYATLYPGIRNAKKQKVKGSCKGSSKGEVTCEVSYEIEF